MQQQGQQSPCGEGKGPPSICAADRTDMGVRCSLTEGQKLHRNNRSTIDKRDAVLMFTAPPLHLTSTSKRHYVETKALMIK